MEQRVIKTAGGVTTVFLYNREGRLITESSATGTIQREYIYFNDEPLALIENGSVYYFANDQLGSGQALFDQYAEMVWQAQYDPFGAAMVSPDSTLVNNLCLPGQYFDSETGLHYNWHRYYEPELGRYLTPDPIGLDGGMNLYVYVGGNPVNLTDPSGEFTIALPVIVGTTVFLGGAWIYLYSHPEDASKIAHAISDAVSDDSSNPNITPGGACPNGDDETLQSRGNTIRKRTADHFGKNRREVGRALESLKTEHGLPNDYHELRIMKSGNVFDKNTGQFIDNLRNYMH